MKTYSLEVLLQAPVEDVFALCWANPDFKLRLHQLISPSRSDADVSAWFPQGKEFRRVCFYTLDYGQGGVRCLETQRYHPTTTGYKISCAIVPEISAGQALRIESEWEIRRKGCDTEVIVHGEVECGGAKIWGAGALVEAALLSPAKQAAQQLITLATELLSSRPASNNTTTTPPPPLVSAPPPRSTPAPDLPWLEFRFCRSLLTAPPSLLGSSEAAHTAQSPSPALLIACTCTSLCPTAVPVLLALCGPNVRDAHGRSALHVVSERCAESLEPLRLSTLRALLSANADAHAVDEHGRTPLHVAASACASVVVAALLTYGAPRSARTKEGFTAEQLAMAAPTSPAQIYTLELLRRSNR